MGTNFYRRNIPAQDEIKTMHRLIDEGHIYRCDDETEDSLIELINRKFNDTEIHICKRSGGWQMTFDHNWGRYYQPNRKSLEEFLSQPGTEIVDEYGRVISSDDFWKMVDEWNADPENNFTSESWDAYSMEKYGKPEWLCREDIIKVKEKFGITTTVNEFTVDGLRFPVYSDFS